MNVLSPRGLLLDRVQERHELGVCVPRLGSGHGEVQGRLPGLLGMSGAVPDLEAIEIDMPIASPDGEEEVQALHRAWLERCPVYLALTKPPSVKTTVSRTA